MTEICNKHLEKLTFWKWKLFDALSEEIFLVDRVAIFFPSHQLPLDPTIDEWGLCRRVLWDIVDTEYNFLEKFLNLLFILFQLFFNIFDNVVDNVILQAHNLWRQTYYFSAAICLKFAPH